MKRYLLLEDGTTYEGNGYGYEGDANGEIVFTTSMSGYLETITDPSIAGTLFAFKKSLNPTPESPPERILCASYF